MSKIEKAIDEVVKIVDELRDIRLELITALKNADQNYMEIGRIREVLENIASNILVLVRNLAQEETADSNKKLS